MHDTVASHMADVLRDGLINSRLTWYITMYISTDEAITQCNILLLFSCPVASSLLYIIRLHYIIQLLSPASFVAMLLCT